MAMISASSLRGQIRAASLLAVILLALVAHTCAPLSLAHSHAPAPLGLTHSHAPTSTNAHQDAPDHAPAVHGACCEAMLLSGPARVSVASEVTGVLSADTAAADTIAPFLELVAAAPALISHRTSHRHRPLFLLHAALRI